MSATSFEGERRRQPDDYPILGADPTAVNDVKILDLKLSLV
jgi:hypothetical protein